MGLFARSKEHNTSHLWLFCPMPSCHGLMLFQHLSMRGSAVCLLLFALGLAVKHVVLNPFGWKNLRNMPSPSLPSPPSLPPVVDMIDTFANASILVASGAMSKTTALMPEPPQEEYLPVFIEPRLMDRKEFPIRHLKNMTLKKMKCTVDDPKDAVFYIICCGPIERLLSLPPRRPETPYLCYDCDAILELNRLADCSKRRNYCQMQLELLARRDIMFSSSDLRWWNVMNDSALRLPGVTHVHPLPDPQDLREYKIKRSIPPHYFLTFQGNRNVGLFGSSFVRLNLEAKMNSSQKPPKHMRGPNGEKYSLPEKIWTPPEDVVINIAPTQVLLKDKKPYYELFNSTYSLVLHGHGRWSYRLMEVLNGEAIPVIMSEGWDLPLSELIDWQQISVQRPESLAFFPETLTATLPRHPEILANTQHHIQEVYNKLLVTRELRVMALLRAAALWKRDWQQHDRHSLRLWVDQERQRLGEQERQIEARRNRSQAWNKSHQELNKGHQELNKSDKSDKSIPSALSNFLRIQTVRPVQIASIKRALSCAGEIWQVLTSVSRMKMSSNSVSSKFNFKIS